MFFFQNISESYPIFSLLFSIILFLGLYQLGKILFINNALKLIFNGVSNLKYQNILIAANFIMIVLLPIVLFYDQSKYVLNLFSIIIFILGIYRLYLICKKKIVFGLRISNYSFENILFFITITGLLLITFSPVNHADSLDYHLSGANYIFKTGKLPTSLENFTYLLVSSGEILYSLSFFYGAEQFGNLIQFSGLVSLIGVLKKSKFNRYFFILLILSSPVILFLSSSPKPQLFHLCSNALLFVILFINFKNIKNTKNYLFNLTVITNIIIINSINAKFSFILSGFIIYLLLAFISYKKKFFVEMILLNLFFLFIFYFGFSYWKYLIWDGNLFNYIFNPFPMHLDGVTLFYNYLVNFQRQDYLIYLFLPKNFGEFTSSLGIGVLIFSYFFIKRKNIYFYFFPIFLFFILINHFFGQPSARFFFELYVWIILLLALNIDFRISNKIKYIFFIQFFISILTIWYGVFTMSYGSLTKNLKDHVMTNTANGYSLFKWANSVLPDQNDRILSVHRSIGLGRENTISTNSLNFLDSAREKIKPYHLKKLLTENKGSTYLLTFADPNRIGIFGECIEYLYLKKEAVGKHVGRNPFNKSSPYFGYIYKLKDLKESNCLKY